MPEKILSEEEQLEEEQQLKAQRQVTLNIQKLLIKRRKSMISKH